VEVLRAAQRLEAQLGVPIAPKAPDRRARPSTAEPAAANPWGPRPAPKSWGLEAAIAALSETWVDSQLAQVPPRTRRKHAPLQPRAFERVCTTWAGQIILCVFPQIHAWVVRQTEQEDWKPVQAERGCARCGTFVYPFTSACHTCRLQSPHGTLHFV
jgi:hypothetical protein